MHGLYAEPAVDASGPPLRSPFTTTLHTPRPHTLHHGLQLSTLVLAEHKSGALQPNTLHALTAANQLGGPITVLVAGDVVAAAAEAASRAVGVASVLAAEDPCLAHGLAEPTAALLAAVQAK